MGGVHAVAQGVHAVAQGVNAVAQGVHAVAQDASDSLDTPSQRYIRLSRHFVLKSTLHAACIGV